MTRGLGCRTTNRQRTFYGFIGAPGAGKSTIATTIARELADEAPFCAKFFSKRDVPDLRDPGRIWPTLAHSLALKHDGVKAALAQALSNKKGNPKDDFALDQFWKLIKLPLEADLKEMGLRSQKTVYPVIIIDALDECDLADDTNWKSLLASLKCWAKLPGVFKLVVTSRDLHDIRTTLGEVSCHVDLTSGDDVSEESRNDIEIFFAKKFGEIKERFRLLQVSDWPTEEEIEAMTEYAAGSVHLGQYGY